MNRLLITLMLLGTSQAAGLSGPMMQLKESNSRIDRILKRHPVAGTPEERSAKEELKSVVNQLLDYQELAHRALAQHWDTITPTQRGEFVATLKQLIEKNYVRQLRNATLDYQVIYKGENVADSVATVDTVVKVKTKGKSTESSIDYKLRKIDDRWMVFDIITDEVSMVRNYRNQFNKIITNESYDALLRKMRKKIEESDPK